MLKKLAILKDEPLFTEETGFDRDQDAFNHQAYAEALFKLIKENDPPLSIGLFGPWGIGKSTVVNILFDLIKKSGDSDLRPIYFNAWKYSGDSFRRQFLIEAAKEVYDKHPDLESQVRRLEQLNYTDVLREEAQKSIVEQLKTLLSARIRFREAGLIRVLLAAIVLAVGAVFSLLTDSVYPFLSTILPAVLFFFLRLRFEDLFVVQETPVYDPKLIFPEQFESEFKKLISAAGPLGKARAIIAIDDIDRCEPDLVRGILISIKTFAGQQNCYFLVPCDDKSIVKVFEDPNQREGYKDEMLRKYFNLGVRMSPLMATDLVDFANSTSRETGIPQEIVQMAILANCRDARKMKHFLNTFVAKYAIAKAREEKGLMPIKVDDHLAAFAKVVLIEDLYPDLFEQLLSHPEVYDLLERTALGDDRAKDLKHYGLDAWRVEYENLEEILQRTRDVRIEHVELFLALKTTNPETRIPRGYQLKNAIIQGDQVLIEQIAKGISSDEARENVAYLLEDLLERATGLLLNNAITASLYLYWQEDLLLDKDKPHVARSVSNALSKVGQKVLDHKATHVLACANAAGATYLREALDKYAQELEQLTTPPEALAETVNALYAFATDRKKLASILNKKLEDWMTQEEVLSALTEIQLPEDLKANEEVPNTAIVRKIASAIAADASESTIRMNELRKAVVFNYWEDVLAPVIAERLFGILQQSAQSETAESSRNAFVIKALLENPKCLEAKFTPQIWPQTQQVHNRTTEWKHKLEAHKVLVLLAAISPDASVKSAAHQFILEAWRSSTYEHLKDVLSYIDTLDEPEKATLQTALLQQELTLAQGEIQNPSERTKLRVKLYYENKDTAGEEALKQFLLKTLDTPDAAFTVWKPEVVEYAKKFKNAYAFEAATKAITLAGGSASVQKRQGLFQLFAELLALIDGEDKVGLLPKYFDLCKHPDANIRNNAVTGISSVKNAIEHSEFRRGLNALARDLFAKSMSEVPAYWPAIDAVLKEREFFGDYEWRDLGDLSKRLMEQADNTLKDYGLSLVELMSELPKDHEGDLVQQLVNTARVGAAVQKEKATKLLEGLQISKLDSATKKVLKEYRKSIEGEKPEA